MKFDIFNRWSGSLQFSADITCDENASMGVKIGLAVKWAVETGARLDGARLDGASLDGARLVNASLDGARLGNIRADFLAEVLNMPNELEGLRDTIIAGKIDGSTYSGECCCLAGTLAKARGICDYKGETIRNGRDFHASASSLRERFFLAIKKGDTPETNPASKIVLMWTEEAIAMRDYIRISTPVTAP